MTPTEDVLDMIAHTYELSDLEWLGHVIARWIKAGRVERESVAEAYKSRKRSLEVPL